MVAATDMLLKPLRPTEEDVDLAQRGSSKLSRLGSSPYVLRVTIIRGREKTEIALPEIVYSMLELILKELAQGHAVALAPVDREISTQKAADLLNVSRPHLIKLLESGQIPFRKVGTHRRIRLGDLLEYKVRMDADAERAFAELVDQAQVLGMGYE
ncbi:MAG TPA: excisionase family DNA-binding protein [Longimicrobium sp.]|nr:excisionase family DNA-binding protein [Longimicrobium sp.]